MKLSVSHQLFVFVCMFFCGWLTGIVFDIFRALRRCVKSGSGVIAAQDLLLWLLELVIVYYTVFKVNNAEVRGYEAVALISGAVVYFIILSEYAVKFISKAIMLLIKIIKFVLKPLKKLVCFIKKPFKKCILFIKIKQEIVFGFVKKIKNSAILHIKTALPEKKNKK